MKSVAADHTLRRVVRLVVVLNLAYFGIEFAVARAIGSVSLFADSIDFLEDASVNFLIFAALGWSAARRARGGMVLAGILLVPAVATLWTAWDKFNVPVPAMMARSHSTSFDPGCNLGPERRLDIAISPTDWSRALALRPANISRGMPLPDRPPDRLGTEFQPDHSHASPVRPESNRPRDVRVCS